MITQKQPTTQLKISNIYFWLILLLSILLLNACKKDDSAPSNGNVSSGSPGINYLFVAPTCLVTSFNGSSTNGQCEYDNSKRLTKISQNIDTLSFVATYAYQGNLMTELATLSSSSGIFYTSTTIHYLNAAGLVEKSIQSNQDPSNTQQTLYYYNNAGYLLREINVSSYKSPYDSTVYNSYYGMSYTYENGNRTKEYDLTMNQQGIATDSSLKMTTVYDVNLRGNISAWGSWMSRKGRANTNEIKSSIDLSDNSSHSYTYTIGANSCPSIINETSNGKTTITSIVWRCQ